MNKQFRSDFRRFLEDGPYCTPPGRAACALQSARTLQKWREMEAAGRVRIQVEPEKENYFDIFGHSSEDRFVRKTIEQWGVHWVSTEYLDPSGEWKHADSIGMCIYQDPADPFQNSYVPGLMEYAIEAHDQAWDEVPA